MVRTSGITTSEFNGCSKRREHSIPQGKRLQFFNFFPLCNNKVGGALASIDILFLRRGNPGEVLQSGDLDNRVKTLLDALKVPKYPSELPSGVNPDEDEHPFFCLLEDDSMITTLNITTDRLLTPLTDHEESDSHYLNNVVLVVHVKTSVLRNTAQYSEVFW